MVGPMPGTSSSSSTLPERSVGRAVRDDPFGEHRSDAGQRVELGRRRGVQVEHSPGRPRDARAPRTADRSRPGDADGDLLPVGDYGGQIDGRRIGLRQQPARGVHRIGHARAGREGHQAGPGDQSHHGHDQASMTSPRPRRPASWSRQRSNPRAVPERVRPEGGPARSRRSGPGPRPAPPARASARRPGPGSSARSAPGDRCRPSPPAARRRPDRVGTAPHRSARADRPPWTAGRHRPAPSRRRRRASASRRRSRARMTSASSLRRAGERHPSDARNPVVRPPRPHRICGRRCRLWTTSRSPPGPRGSLHTCGRRFCAQPSDWSRSGSVCSSGDGAMTTPTAPGPTCAPIAAPSSLT